MDKKDNKILLIWSDIPQWIIIDDEFFTLLEMFNGKNKVEDIVRKLSKMLSQSIEKTKEQVKQILAFLINMNVVYDTKNKTSIPGIKECKISEIIIHPTNRCNLNCRMCSNKYNQIPKEKEIDINKIKRFIDEALKFSVDGATLSIVGGEPLLEAEKTLEIARYAKKIGISEIGISTNGTLMTKEFARETKKLGMGVQVSIDGVTEKENDYLRGKGTFKKIIHAIKILKSEDVYVMTNFLCHKGNFSSLEKYFKMALDLKVDSARFGPIKRIGAGINDELNYLPVDVLLRDSYRLIKNHLEYRKLIGKDYLSAFANSCRLKVKYGYCGTGMAVVLLNPDGGIYPCSGHALPEFKAGNILNDSFSNIWLKSPILNKLRKTYPVTNINDRCSKCIVRHFCLGGCRAEAYHCTKSMNSPAIECENIKKAIIEMIWNLASSPFLGTGKTYRFD